MKFTLSHQANVTIVRLEGPRLDIVSSSALKKVLAEQVEQGVSRIVLDFEVVGFMDSSGLGVLISLLKQLGNHGDMVLCRIEDSSIRDILRLTRMDQLFEIVDSCDGAVRKLQG
jgi:anti-sigma B factor antagonist